MSSRRTSHLVCVVLCFILVTPLCMQGQSSSSDKAANSGLPSKPPSKTSGKAAAEESRAATVVPGPLLRNIVYDQKTIWTSPFKAKVEDLNWIVPMVGLTA
ncbi:MAG TPA: hypothetical protein VFW31_12650, partial [Candidatus Angelobacter sp.]|nr:hypothetical protein [Candidatus Angelobacter sp.]